MNQNAESILARVFPRLLNMIVMLVQKPVSLIWDPTIETASTDCQAHVRLSPNPFLDGLEKIGFGSAIHEGGHILWTPNGVKLLQRAHQQGGESRRHILNIIIDRKDDKLTSCHAPGRADLLRSRMLYIATMTIRKELLQRDERFVDYTNADFDRILHNFKPRDVWEDFFFAAKWGKTARYAQTRRAMRKIRMSKLLTASGTELLWMAQKIHEILGEPVEETQEKREEQASRSGLLVSGSGGKKKKKRSKKSGKSAKTEPPKKNDGQRFDQKTMRALPSSDQKKAVEKFIKLARIAYAIEQGFTGTSIDPEIAKLIEQIIAQHLSHARSEAMKKMRRLLRREFVWPGALSTGETDTIEIKKVKPNVRHAAEHARLETAIRPYLARLLAQLRKIDSPSEYELSGLHEGDDLDLTDSARIAAGFSPTYTEIVVEYKLDAEIGLALDCSGSMYGNKLEFAKRLVKLFSLGITAKSPELQGRVWAFNSYAIFDYGPINLLSGFVSVEADGGNSDTHLLKIAGKELLASNKKRKVLIVVCDDGPDNLAEAKRLAQELLDRGILVIHILVGVHATPDVYPVEMLFTTMEECLENFGPLIVDIIKNLR